MTVMAAQADVERYGQRERERAHALTPIDPLHMDLAAFVDDIALAVEAGITPGQVAHAVDELLERVGADLAFEERVMSASDYPQRAEHEGAHREFAFELSSVASTYLAASDATLVAPVLGCVRRWLCGHGPDLDCKLAAFLRSAQR